VQVHVAESYAELEQRLVAGEVDFAWAPPLVCAKAEPRARAILKAVRSGKSTYCSALVGREERGLTVSAPSLAGLRAAWVDPLSAGGYLLPALYLRAQGCEPDRTFSSQVFLGSYRAALRAVIVGDADVAPVYASDATEEAARTAMAECVGPERTRLAPIAYSGEAPNDGFILTDRFSRGAADAFVKRLAPFAAASQGPNLLLAVLAADRLELAAAGEYGRFAARLKAG